MTASRNQRSCATRITAASMSASSRSSHSMLVHVEVVRRLVEQQQVGPAGERARERGARELAAREGARAAGRGRRRRSRARARPRRRGRATRSRPRARGAPAPSRSSRACARRGRRRSWPARAGAARARWRRGRRRRRARTRAGQRPLERRPLVVQRDPRPLLERELAAVLLGLAGEDPEQRRLAGAVRPGERDPVAALDLERDAVEEQVARRAPCAGWMRSRRPRSQGRSSAGARRATRCLGG